MAEAKKAVGTLVKVILGLALLVAGVIAILRWWHIILMLIKGCIGPFLILVGAIFLLLAKD